MDQDDNEDINSLYLNYDLSTNYLYGVQVKSLKETSMLQAVVNSFGCDEAVQKFTSELQGLDDEDANNLFYIVANKLQIQSLPMTLVFEVRLVIVQVFDEIKRFLASIFLHSDKYFFLGNFVFNWQGGINSRETVLRVLNRNILSTRERFEFSCKYLFDENLILTHFNNLIPYDIEQYFINYLDISTVHRFLIYCWVWKFSVGHFNMALTNFEVWRNYLFANSTFFTRFFSFVLYNELAVKYLFEIFNNIIPSSYSDLFENFGNVSVYHYVLHDLLREPYSLKINSVMYLLFQLREDEFFTVYAYEILSKLIKNSRWHDTFIRYFRLLRFHVRNGRYLSLIHTVLIKMWVRLKAGGNARKCINIWRTFIQLIPIWEENFMINTYGREYVEMCFQLFTYQEIDLIEMFLFIGSNNNINVSDAFYELATTYFDLFAEVYRQCSNNIESFLRKVITSEDEVSHLLMRLRYSTSSSFRITMLGHYLWNEAQTFMEWVLHKCIIIEELKREWKYLLGDGEFVNSLTKVKYAERFLSFGFTHNQLVIYYRERIVRKINFLLRK
ncbi:UNVERIFIED_CONTAM: hypothetical protein RMT77_011788 [Armadillidium vulgare]